MCNISLGGAWFPFENIIHTISIELDPAFLANECLISINIDPANIYLFKVNNRNKGVKYVQS